MDPWNTDVNRLLTFVLGTTLACAACKVERTPPEFFDQRSPAVSEREAALGELRARLSLLAQALSRGDSEAALATLTPAPGAFVIGVGVGEERAGRRAVSAALAQVMALGPVRMDVQDMQLAVSPRGNVAWFAAYLTPPGLEPTAEGAAVLRVSGVYVRHEGSWQLMQAHLSFPSAADGLNGAAPAP
jgi:ketosteroid isomerase-like protein